MAITTGDKWAIYLLMAQHTGPANTGLKSDFRTQVEAAVNGGALLKTALLNTATAKVNPEIDGDDVGDLQSFDAVELRNSLSMTDADAFYNPIGGGPCPPATPQGNIVSALKTKFPL